MNITEVLIDSHQLLREFVISTGAAGRNLVLRLSLRFRIWNFLREDGAMFWWMYAQIAEMSWHWGYVVIFCAIGASSAVASQGKTN